MQLAKTFHEVNGNTYHRNPYRYTARPKDMEDGAVLCQNKLLEVKNYLHKHGSFIAEVHDSKNSWENSPNNGTGYFYHMDGTSIYVQQIHFDNRKFNPNTSEVKIKDTVEMEFTSNKSIDHVVEKVIREVPGFRGR